MNYYNEIAEGYEELHEDEQLAKLNAIKSLLEELKIEISPNHKLLDVGCGSGISTRFWDFTECERIGLDPADKLIEIAQKKDINGQYFVEPAENISLEDKLFDFVTCITAIHNFENLDMGISEIKRVSKNIIIFSILKTVIDFKNIVRKIKTNFQVIKEFEGDKDSILICKKL
ncbi:MAG: methyltransferase domain-containing protein [Nanoarchaeota archaeon]|nr:methyltransferase domain-containing protein [Nanoarchaeota archaeon]